MAAAPENFLPKRRRVSLAHSAGGLPAVIFNLVASGLPAADVVAFCNTNPLYSQQWCQSEQLWKLLFERDFQRYPLARIRPGESWRLGYKRAYLQQAADEAQISFLSQSLVQILARRFYDNELNEDDIDRAFAALDTTNIDQPHMGIDFGYEHAVWSQEWPPETIALNGTLRSRQRDPAFIAIVTNGLETKVTAEGGARGRLDIMLGTLRKGHAVTDIPVAVSNMKRLLRQWASIGGSILRTHFPVELVRPVIGVLPSLFSRVVVL